MVDFRSKPVGWRGESYRHYLASKGVKTKHVGMLEGYPKVADGTGTRLPNEPRVRFVHDEKANFPIVEKVLRDVDVEEMRREDKIQRMKGELPELRGVFEDIPIKVKNPRSDIRGLAGAKEGLTGEFTKEQRNVLVKGRGVVEDPEGTSQLVDEFGREKERQFTEQAARVTQPYKLTEKAEKIEPPFIESIEPLERMIDSEKTLEVKARAEVLPVSDLEAASMTIEDQKGIVRIGSPNIQEFMKATGMSRVDAEKVFKEPVEMTRAAAFQRFTQVGPASEAFDILKKRGLLKQMEGRTVVRGEVFDRKPKKGEMSEADLLQQTLLFAQDTGGEKSVKQNLKIFIDRLKDAEVAGLRVETRTHPSYVGQFTQTGKLRKKPPMVEVKRVVTREVGLPKERDLPLVGQEKDPVLASKAFFDRQIAIKELKALL